MWLGLITTQVCGGGSHLETSRIEVVSKGFMDFILHNYHNGNLLSKNQMM